MIHPAGANDLADDDPFAGGPDETPDETAPAGDHGRPLRSDDLFWRQIAGRKSPREWLDHHFYRWGLSKRVGPSTWGAYVLEYAQWSIRERGPCGSDAATAAARMLEILRRETGTDE